MRLPKLPGLPKIAEIGKAKTENLPLMNADRRGPGKQTLDQLNWWKI